MPIYEYQCQACQHQLETLQKISDEPLTLCPACNKAELKKLVSASAFRLKGGGWYETDFKTGNKKNLASDGASTASADTGSGATAPAKASTKDTKPGASQAKSSSATAVKDSK